MCGRFALSVDLIDLPQLFNDTALNHYDSLSSGNSDGDNTDNTTDSSRELHSTDSSHYVSGISLGNSSVFSPNDFPVTGKQIENEIDFSSKEQYKSLVEILIKYPEPGKIFKKSYNIPPTGSSVIIYQIASKKNVDYTYVIETLTFGLVPSWAKPTDPEPVQRDGQPGPAYSKELQRHQGRQFNCRKESMGKGNALPTWNSHKRKTRCVVPILGYFEWKKTNNSKVPHFIHSSTSPIIYLAGLYSHNTKYQLNEDDEYFSSFSIVTGPCSLEEDVKDMSWLHSRKPLVLNPGSKEWFEWLDPERDWDDGILDTVLDTKATTAYNDIEAYPVGSLVGKTGSKGAELIAKVDPNTYSKSPQKLIMLFFSPTKRKPLAKREADTDPEASPVKKSKQEPHVDIYASMQKIQLDKRELGNIGSEYFIKREKNVEDEEEQ